MVEKKIPPAAASAYEPDTIDVRRIVAAALIVIAVVVVCAFAVALLDRVFARGLGHGIPPPRSLQPPPVAGPALQADPQSEIEAYRASQQSALHAYRWIDRSKGIAQIPIEQAMRRLAERDGAHGDAQ